MQAITMPLELLILLLMVAFLCGLLVSQLVCSHAARTAPASMDEFSRDHFAKDRV